MVTLNFKTISPLHISNGNELAQNLHYIIDGQQIYVLDPIKTSALLAEKKAFDFKRNYSIEDIRAIISSRKDILTESCSIYSIDMTPEFLQYLGRENRIGQTYIHEFINSNGLFYIPASSVKGALLTILHREHLGIKEERIGDVLKPASIKDKFVIHDSDAIPEESFIIIRTGIGRPPVNIMCLDAEVEFSLKITKLGNLSVSELKSKLKSYYNTQINKAMNIIKSYKSRTEKPGGADIFNDALETILGTALDKNEFLLNLGFGGSSWFKLYDDAPLPTFKNRKTKMKENAHTAFVTADKYNDLFGWCILTIEE